MLFCCCCCSFFQNTVFPSIPGVSWTIPKRELLSNQCISYLLTAVGVFFFKFKVAKNNSFHPTGNLLYLKGEYQIYCMILIGKQKGKIYDTYRNLCVWICHHRKSCFFLLRIVALIFFSLKECDLRK